MLELALIAVRILQYTGAMILLGSALFFIYALPAAGPSSAAGLGWPRRLLLAGAAVTLVAALAGLVVQTSVMAGSFTEGLKSEALGFVVAGTGLGRAGIVRAVASGLAVALLLTLSPGRTLWLVLTTLGAVVSASLAWMGHGAATEGPGAPLHLVSDVFHSIAAAVWIGALLAFLILLWPRAAGAPERQKAVHSALHGFSGVGTAAVGVLVATGAVNSWFLVGLERLEGLWTTPYGQLLSAKLLLFALMLLLAAANRFRLTPALARVLDAGAPPAAALQALRRSLILENAAAFGILALVAWFGTLEPIAAR